MSATRARALLLTATLALATPVAAQQTSAPGSADAGAETAGTDTALIGDDAGRALAGRGAINLVAGSGNVQANLAAIALSPDGQGLITLQAQQRASLLPAQLADLRERDASARIDGHAFADSVGLLSVNQAAGSGNAQINLFALGNTDADAALAAGGLAGLDDATLAAVAGNQPTEETGAPTGLRHAVIADDAFRGSQGVVQVNQTAGVGNFSTNAIVLQLPGGAP